MNERIQDLVNEAREFATTNRVHNPTFDMDVFHEKFAELIVLEFVRYFNEDYKRDFSVLWREDLSEGIMKHFGVKDA